MARTEKKEIALTTEEKLAQALVPDVEQPYRVPENWCWTNIGALSSLHRGVSYKKDDAHADKQENDCLVMRGGNIGEGYIDVDADNVYVDLSLVNKDQLVKKNDIIIVASTGSTKVIGRAGISFDDYSDVAFGAFLIAVRPSEKAIPRYMDFFFQSDLYRNRIRDLASGVTINNIRSDYITESPYPLPPLAEQQRIVDRIESLFAKLDEAKEKAQAVVDGFEDRKSTILHKAFSGDLTGDWREKHGFSSNVWEHVRLSDVCTVNPNKANTKDLPDDLEVSFFPMPALSEVYGTITEPQTRKLSEVRTGFTNFSEGDVVFAKITPCMENGKSAVIGTLVNNLGFGTTEFFVLRCGEKLYNRYLWHMVRGRAFRNEAKTVMSGAVGQQRVPKSFLENYPLQRPSVEEQKEIVCILDNLFTKEQQAKEIAEQLVDQIDAMKKSILARAFRGELGTNDPADESAVELLKRVLWEDQSGEPTPKSARKRTIIPKEIEAQLSTELERDIIKLFLKANDTIASMDSIMALSSKKFEILEALRTLETRRLIQKNGDGTYSLLK